jgi:hypothetical protein
LKKPCRKKKEYQKKSFASSLMYYSTRHLCTKGKNNYTYKSTSINGVYVVLINNKLIIIKIKKLVILFI